MSLDYYNKKQQHGLNQHCPVDCNVSVEAKSRVSSPAPVARAETRGSADKKVAYRADLEELKRVLSDSFGSRVSALEKQIDELKTIVDSFNKQLEGTKTEHLRQVLNDSIKQHNSRAEDFENDLSSHLKHINSILSRVDGIEQLL